ncbi:MAG: TRAP transporter large permease [Rhodospirillaceae bacterium]|jgi:C4-dicarboxylate transporter, DctM subunit|nr:TRAP transporter large permease [Rhodospirillaceae bacterium]MBT7268997.1 TRAP transporter large permease [Rhodospirillaceae bacterium]
MNEVEIGVFSVVAVLVLVYIGMHVGVVLSLVSYFGVWMIREDATIAGKLLAAAAAESLRRFEFGVIPLFVLMGLLVSVSGIGKETYDVANHLFRRVRAGLGTATVVANAVFAAVTGSSIASASVFTKVAVPEMLRLGYNPRFAVGVVAGSSVLGMLIPPSMLLILFGILTESSIGDLFIAGILPGILLAFAFTVLIAIMARKFPEHVMLGGTEVTDTAPHMTQRELYGKLIPILTLIVIVLGGIWGGIFTATEAGGVGAFGAFGLALLKRSLTFKSLWRVLTETGHVTAAICFLLISAHLYGKLIVVSGIPGLMEGFIEQSGLSPAELLVIYLVAIVLLGTILDSGSIMLITVPLAFPVLMAMDVNLTWFGIVTIVAVEIGLLTPPLGLACFVIHNNLGDSNIKVGDIFIGASPFAVTMLVVLILIVLFPEIALYLV